MINSMIGKQRGVGLIEILVTVLLLSTSLLALAALQTRSLQFNQGAYFRSQANILAYDILDRIRLNRDNINSYDITETGTPPAAGSSVAATDLNEWRTSVESNLPGGKSAIACNANSMCTVTISWDELNNSGEESEDVSSFSYSAKI